MLTVSTCTHHHYINIVFIYLLEVQSTGVKEATTYAGIIYYEEEDLVTFAAARDLNALIEVSVPSLYINY